MSWQVNNGPLEPVPQQMLTDLRSACGVNDSAADATTNVAQLALRGSRSGSNSSDGAVHSAGSSGNDSPPAVRGTPPAAQELTQQQMMQLLQQQQQQMQQQQEQMQQMQQQMQQMAAQSGSKPLPRPPATSSSSSSNPRLDAALAKASQARAAALEQQARLAPLFASTPATAAASTSTPGAPAAQTQPTPCAPIPASECFTYQGKSYYIPGMTKQINPTTLSFQLNDGTEETVNVATMCTQPITFKEGFNPSFKIHMLLENKKVPFETLKALLHPDFLPVSMINLYSGQSASLLHEASSGGIKKVRFEDVSSSLGTTYQKEIVEETIVGYLLERGANVNIPIKIPERLYNNYLPATPLHSAAYDGNYHECKQLLEAGANPRGFMPVQIGTDWVRKNQTALHSAAEHGHVEIVRLLLEWGLDPDAADDFGNIPLKLAGTNEKKAVMALLIEGFDAEMKAFESGRVVSKGTKRIEANVTKLVNGAHPLQFVATSWVETSVLRTMINRGADPKAKPFGAMGPCVGAIVVAGICSPAGTGRAENLELILEHCKDSSGTVPHSVLTYKGDSRSRTPLENAKKLGRKDLADILTRYGAGQNAVVSGAINMTKKGAGLFKGSNRK